MILHEAGRCFVESAGSIDIDILCSGYIACICIYDRDMETVFRECRHFPAVADIVTVKRMKWFWQHRVFCFGDVGRLSLQTGLVEVSLHV